MPHYIASCDCLGETNFSCFNIFGATSCNTVLSAFLFSVFRSNPSVFGKSGLFSFFLFSFHAIFGHKKVFYFAVVFKFFCFVLVFRGGETCYFKRDFHGRIKGSLKSAGLWRNKLTSYDFSSHFRGK